MASSRHPGAFGLLVIELLFGVGKLCLQACNFFIELTKG